MMYSSDKKAPYIKSEGIVFPLLSVLHYLRKTVNIAILAVLLPTICTSCVWDPEPNGYFFSVENLTDDSLIIVTDEIIPKYSVQVSNYSYNDSILIQDLFSLYYKSKSDTVFVIPSHAVFNSFISWESRDRLSDIPEEDGITPAWKFIKRIEIAGKPVSPEMWNSMQKWRISSEYEKIERTYTLTFK